MSNLRKKRRSVSKPLLRKIYKTERGYMLNGKIEDALASAELGKLKGKVSLIFTSPPFPLVRKKRYGNETGEAYLTWLSSLAPKLCDLLTEDGSIVIELGNAWVEGSPTMSTLTLEALLAFKKAGNLHLCQHVICHNPARLPSPAAWVNVERIRLKDSYTHVWWLSRSERPKADNRRVLTPYSKEMEKLLRTKKYNSGVRPSGHKISKTGFLKNHGGAIAANVIDVEESEAKLPNSLLKFSGTAWDAKYRAYCKKRGFVAHPARMQTELVAFFIQFLTDKRDIVLDPFGGSNTTGAVAEELGRKWVSVEAERAYIEGSKGRFKKFQRGLEVEPAGRSLLKRASASKRKKSSDRSKPSTRRSARRATSARAPAVRPVAGKSGRGRRRNGRKRAA